MFLPAVGTLSYNGYTFDGSSKITVNVEMVQDEAQRTIIYQRQTITVRATIANDPGDTDAQLETIKEKLGEQGRALVFINKGFGHNVNVNSPGGPRDVKWGPTPKILMWEPIGSSLCCEVEWQCVVNLALCDATRPNATGLMAFNYEVSFSINNVGDTTRTISGYIEIAQTRKGKRAPDCADLYRHLINPPVPKGFERRQEYRVSKDKSRLDFNVTDTQIPSKFPYPTDATSASGRHRVQWGTGARGKTTLKNTISMEIALRPGVSQAVGFNIFGTILKKRIEWAKSQKMVVLLDELTIEEDIWGRSSSFSASYRILQTAAKIFLTSGIAKHAGLWRPIDTDWTRWALSMSQVFGIRGTAGLKEPAGDIIVDLCGRDKATWTSYSESAPEPYPPDPKPTYANDMPPPDKSYLEFESIVVPERDRPVQRQSILQETETPTSLQGGKFDTKDEFAFGKPMSIGHSLASNAPVPDTIQEGGRSRYAISLVGTAMRAGYPVPRPSIEKVGDQTPIEVASVCPQQQIANWFGVPIYKAYWKIDYMLERPPGKIEIQKNYKDVV